MSDDSARVGRGKLLDLPNGSMCSVEIGVQLVVPHGEAPRWELLAPVHHSELIPIVSFHLHVQLNFPGRVFGWDKQTQTIAIHQGTASSPGCLPPLARQ